MKAEDFHLVTFLGIRPDLIRMQKVLELVDARKTAGEFRHTFVHSGQHFDYELDGVFYEELGVRAPDVVLGVGKELKQRGTTSHVHQAGLLFERTAQMLEQLKPDAVMFLGDTNTVLASVIVARQQVPVIHIEGGMRNYDWRTPEEKNRIVTDHLSDLVYCYLPRHRKILRSEGLEPQRIHPVGNLIVDAVKSHASSALRKSPAQKLGVQSGKFVLCTIHREENIENPVVFETKIRELMKLSQEIAVVFPVMPRVAARLERQGLKADLDRSGVIQTKPLGFHEFLALEQQCKAIVTDSGTVQEEALILGKPCLVTRRSTERPETIWAGGAILADNRLYENARRVLDMRVRPTSKPLNPDGGSPSTRLVTDLRRRIVSGFFSKSRSFQVIRSNPRVREAYGGKPQ